MFSKLYAIAHNTFVETVRQPIFGVLTWSAVGFLALNPALASFTLQAGEDVKVLKEVALATLMLFALMASVFAAGGVVGREIENFTALTIVSKPVPRPLFVLGKYLGVAAAMLVAYYILSLTVLMTARHGVMEMASDKLDMPVIVFSIIAVGVSVGAALFGNYTYGWNFLATLTTWILPLGTLALLAVLFIDKTWKPQSPLKDFGDMQLIYAILLTALGALVLTAFAVTLSTRFSQVVTLLLCSGVYMLGLLSDHLFGGVHLEQGMHYRLLYAVVPNFQYFLIGDALTQSVIVPGQQIVLVAGYALLYIFAVLSLGIALFQTREVG